ncbi:MAG: PAS domain S-box protein [Bacteroidales bacterium]|nr:PAS domain S-box protein [Bacteroidales bacterium]MCF8327617.1 PAS domain S-box protein [Bacteroidales bacterium]
MLETKTTNSYNPESSAELILNDLNIGVFQFDSSGDIVFLNEPFKKQINHNIQGESSEAPVNLISGDFNHAILQKIASYIPDVLEGESQISRDFCINDNYYRLEVRASGTTGQPYYTGMVTDITDSKHTQLKLHNRQRELISLMDNLPGMAFRCKYDEQWTMMFLSRACQDLTGYSTDDILWNQKLSYKDLIFPDDREWVNNTVKKAVRQHNRYQIEYRIVDKQGRIKWMYEQAKAYVNKEGEIEFIEGIILDITSRKYAEKVQRAVGLIAEMSMQEINFDNEKYFQNVQNLIASFMNAEYLSVVYYDAYNDQLKVLYSSDNIMLHDLKEVDDPKKTLSYKVIKESKSLLLNSEEIKGLENQGDIKIYGKEGEQWLGIPMRLNNGNKGAVVVQNYESEVNLTSEDLKSLELIVHQISLAINRKDAVDALANREKYYRNLYMNLPVSYQTLDESGKIQVVNERWLDLLGYSNHEVTGKSFGDFWAAEGQTVLFRAFWKNFINAGYIDRQLIKIQKRNGEVRDVILTGHKETDQLGSFIRAHLVFVDVTVVVQAEEKMRQAKEKAEENDKLKSAFLANMSHEIRSPMNAILGFSDLLRNPYLEQEKREVYIGLVHERGEDLMRIIDDIIDISKLEAGMLKLQYEQVDMKKFVGNLEMSCRQEQKRLKKDDVNVAVECEPEIYDLNWFIDSVRLRQILINFVNNALKFTTDGYVKINIKRKGSEILFSVHDTGIGIPKDKQEYIFERFRQVDLEYKTAGAGTGLGLSISRNLAEQMNGEIQVESEPGKGSVFTLIVPFRNIEAKSEEKKQESAEAKNSDKAHKSSNPQIGVFNLVKDDVAFIQDAFQELNVQLIPLSSNNYQRENIEDNSVIPDLVLLGCYSGDDKTYDHIQFLKKTYQKIPVVLLLNRVCKSEKDKLKKSEIDDYVDMPTSQELLKTVVEKYLNG